MTATSVRVRLDVVPRRAGHFGARRALAAVPAIVGSGLLLIVLFGWLGEWEGAVLLGWIGTGAAVLSRTGERIAVRVGAGFHRPTKEQGALLAPAWAAALARAGLVSSDADLYVQRSREPNAFAAGRRSIAVTTGVLAKFSAHGTANEYLVAILVHELGHHATRATKFALATMWLASPWRIASRLAIGIGLATVGRRQPMRLLAAVVVAGMVIAVVQAVQQRQCPVAAVLTTVAVCSVACPLLDAGVSRRSEYAADRHAADAGMGAQLAAALQVLARSDRRQPGVVARLLDRHPALTARMSALASEIDVLRSS